MKLLSIIIPTIGRIDYLKLTLDAFREQVIRNSEEIEFLVVDNGSSDATQETIGGNHEYSWLSYHRYDNQVFYADSIQRAVKLSSGKFVMLFGDDDIPLPTAVESLLGAIHRHPDVGLIHTNVLIGKDYGDMKFQQLQLECNVIGEAESEHDIKELLYKHPMSMGFITTVVFQRKVWDNGLKNCDPTGKGYAHLFIWFHGIGDNKCLYYPYPLALGRVPYSKDYIDKWPKYFFTEIPSLMKEIDSIGVTDRLYEVWTNSPDWKSFPKFCNTLLMASAFKERYKPMCKEINKYQSPAFRKMLTYLVIYLAPKGLYGAIRKIIYKQ